MVRPAIFSAFLSLPFLGAALDAAAVVRLYTLGFEVAPPRSIIAVGDINGDGIPDLVVEGQSSGGVAAVTAVDGRHGRVVWTVSQPPTYLIPQGPGIAALGDVNGDGKSDIAVGQPNRTITTPNGSLAYAGGVEVRSGADGTLLFRVDGSQAQAFFGQTIAPLGDISSDGVPDFIACAPGTPDNLQPVATPTCDAISGLTGGLIYRVTGSFSRAGLGVDLSSIGDINGDGKSDLLVAGVNSSAALFQDGFVEIRSGANGALLGIRTGATNQRLGYFVQAVGDLNGDGREEIVVADSPVYGGPGQGYLMSVQSSGGGSAALVGNTALPVGGTRIVGATSVGDANGDGVRDLILGFMASLYNSAPLPQIVSGVNGQFLGSIQPGETAGSDSFGTAIATIGDVNGDGRMEVAIGGRGASPNGEASVYSLTNSAAVKFGCGSGPQNTLAVIGAPVLGNTITIQARIPQAANSYGLIVAGVKGFEFAGFDFNLQPNQCRTGSDPGRMGFNYVQTDAQGVFTLSLPIPNDPNLRGLDVYIEAWGIQPNGSNVYSTEALVFNIL